MQISEAPWTSEMQMLLTLQTGKTKAVEPTGGPVHGLGVRGSPGDWASVRMHQGPAQGLTTGHPR